MSAAPTRQDILTIANAGTTSNRVKLDRGLVASITIPASLAGLTTITFQRAIELNGTYTTITNLASGSAGALSDFTVTLTASKTIPLPADVFKGAGFIRVVGNTTTSAAISFTLNYVEAA